VRLLIKSPTTESTPASLRTNVTFSLGTWFFPIILTVIVTPIMVRKLGAECYGVWAMLNSVVSLSGFFAVGFNDALIKHVSHALSINDRVFASRLIRSNLFVFSCVTLTLVLLAWTLSAFVVESIIRPSPSYLYSSKVAFVVVTATFGLSLVSGSYGAVLAGLRRYDLLAGWAILVSLFARLVQGGVALIHPDLVCISVWGLVVQVLSLAAMVVLVRRIVPGLSISPRPFSDALSRLSGFSVYRVLDAVLALGFLQFDRALVGVMVGVENVMYYSVPSTVAQMLGHGSGAVASPLLPTASCLLAQKEREKLQTLYFRATRILGWFVLSGVAILAVFSDKLLEIWLGIDFAANAGPALRWLVLAWGMIALTNVAANVIYGMGQAKVNMLYRLIQTTFAIVGILVFVPAYGVQGAAWGLSIGGVLSAALMFIHVERALGARMGGTFSRGLLRPLSIAAILVLFAWPMRSLIDGAVTLFVVCGGALLGSIALAYFCNVITAQDLAFLKVGSRLRRILSVIGRLKPDSGPRA
jgi:O-antigen/teichoic acid export membrane protein